MLFEKVNVIMNLLAFVVMLLIASTLAAHNHCPPNTYFNTTFKKCINCSTCPDNEIIRSPCSPYEDLSCGPFVEFNRFVVGDKHKQQNKSRVHHPYWKPDSYKPVIHHEPNIGYTKPRMNQPALVTTINQDTTPWKTIALSLISIICTSVVLLLVAVIVVHFYKKRNSGYDKEVIYDTNNESGMTEVCYSTLALDYMQKTRPSSALWMYTPAYHKSQDLLLNQHPEPEVSAPFASNTEGTDECTEKEHCAASSCTQHKRDSNVVDYGHQHHQYVMTNTPNIPSSNNTNSRSQSLCSCNNHFPDYVFFNLAQNEYLEK